MCSNIYKAITNKPKNLAFEYNPNHEGNLLSKRAPSRPLDTINHTIILINADVYVYLIFDSLFEE